MMADKTLEPIPVNPTTWTLVLEGAGYTTSESAIRYASTDLVGTAPVGIGRHIIPAYGQMTGKDGLYLWAKTVSQDDALVQVTEG